MKTKKTISHIFLIIGACIMILPFIYMLLISLMTYQESIAVPPTVIPEHLLFSNYAEVFDRINFGTYMLNSIIVTIATVIGTLIIATLAGFVFAKLEFPFKKTIFVIVIGIMLVPSQMFLIPQFETMVKFGWINTLIALIVPNWVTAYGIFYMRQFFMTIPDSLMEAAIIDGESYFGIYRKIALPLVKPGVIVFGIQTAIGAWNDLLWPLIVNSDSSKATLPVAISLLSGQYIVDTPIIMAASAMVILPMIILYIIGQKHFTKLDLSMK